ncbi:MAG TPA: LytTR family DNA-binding domain-containing protein [Ignavibacteriaceae bacterium]
MSKISCIIIEDEPLAVKILTDYISQIPFLILRGSFKDAILASEYLRDHKIDLMFLDIHLPKLKGMNFLRALKNPPAVIVTSAYHQYAVEGFALNVTDYLLKPFEFERFLAAVNKIKASHPQIQTVPNEGVQQNYIFLSVQKRKVKIFFADIQYIESQREYVKVVTSKKVLLTKMSTKEIESLLPTERFKRIHRSFIIALDKIESYNSETVEINGVSIPIGRDYKNVLDD